MFVSSMMCQSCRGGELEVAVIANEDLVNNLVGVDVEGAQSIWRRRGLGPFGFCCDLLELVAESFGGSSGEHTCERMSLDDPEQRLPSLLGELPSCL